MKTKRVRAGVYMTDDGLRIWREPYSTFRWYVNDDDLFDETFYTGGFGTKYEAIHWVEKNRAWIDEERAKARNPKNPA